VVLLDTNPHQKKVLSVELALVEGIIQKLNQPGNVFSVITFGTKVPSLLKAAVLADAAIGALRNVTLEQTTEKYFSVRFYDALNLATNQFTDETRSRSLLVISFPAKHSKRRSPEHNICNLLAMRRWSPITRSTAQREYNDTDLICGDWLERPMANTLN
jgi:hypothetical protein